MKQEIVSMVQKSISRRKVLESIAGFTAAGALSKAIPAMAAGEAAVTVNPKWYGFNLLEYFSIDKDWMQHFPYKDDERFREDDFRWMRDWGFNWARLPMDYRLWTDSNDLMKIREKDIAPIDRAVKLGEKYGIHINICLCRAPGEWILDEMARESGIRQEPEKTSVYTNQATFDAFVHQWAYFAERYKGISGNRLSFDLVNEPLERGKDNETGRKDYARLARASIEAIRSRDPQRTIVSDGYPVGGDPVAELYDTGVTQSCHDYRPAELCNFRLPWSRPWSDTLPVPAWPLKDKNGKIVADQQIMRTGSRAWMEPAKHGVPIHFGEMGCGGHTPPDVVYAWFNDTLDLINELNSGWALWNFRGQFGILDSGREGTDYKNWHGHQLDETLLKLLQSKMRK
jgi:endoglucanase